MNGYILTYIYIIIPCTVLCVLNVLIHTYDDKFKLVAYWVVFGFSLLTIDIFIYLFRYNKS